jgi:hypothetical protein
MQLTVVLGVPEYYTPCILLVCGHREVMRERDLR